MVKKSHFATLDPENIVKSIQKRAQTAAETTNSGRKMKIRNIKAQILESRI